MAVAVQGRERSDYLKAGVMTKSWLPALAPIARPVVSAGDKSFALAGIAPHIARHAAAGAAAGHQERSGYG